MDRHGALSVALVGRCPERVRIVADALAIGLAWHGCHCVVAEDGSGNDADLVLRLDGGDCLTAKIALWHRGDPLPCAGDPSLLAVVADRPLAVPGVLVLNRDDPATLVAFVAGWRAGLAELANSREVVH